MSITLLVAAVGIPKVFPQASPRRVVQLGFLALFAGIVVLVALARRRRRTRDRDLADAARRPRHRCAGIAARGCHRVVGARRAEQRGRRAPEHGTNLGASIGTALAGAVLISTLTTSFLIGIEDNPAVPDKVASSAAVELADGVPFVSDADLETALDEAGVP